METRTKKAWCPECKKEVDFILTTSLPTPQDNVSIYSLVDFMTCSICKEVFRILPVYGESYKTQWGKIDFTKKVVLDIGADYGSTADFFLLRGAKKVIAVEGDKKYYEELIRNADLIPGITPCFCYINSAEDISSLLTFYEPDIVKSDCEGCEIHLAGIPTNIFRIPQDYIIEIHQHNVFDTIMPKFKECGYEIRDINEWLPEEARKQHGFVPIVWAQRV